MARKIPVADEAVAQVALERLAQDFDNAQIAGDVLSAETYTEYLIESAARVQFQPSTRRLVLTFDLGMASSEEPAGT